MKSLIRFACAALVLGSLPLRAAEPAAGVERATLIVVGGAAGEAEFGQSFKEQLEAWTKTAKDAGANFILIGDQEKPATPDRERLKQALTTERKDGTNDLWLVLVGHGTFDGKEAKFNLRDADISATELSEWLKPFTRPLALINTSSSSAPFMAKLAGPKRAVVTSTRSGHEQNFSRFGKYFAEAFGDTKTDIDKDGQISLLEAYLSASHRTAEFYKTEGRLATEHALIDDNGDGLGTPVDWFRGVRATKSARDGATADGARAHQYHLVRSAAEQQLPQEIRAKRDALELEIGKLRDTKAKMPESRYYEELEKLLLQLADIYGGA